MDRVKRQTWLGNSKRSASLNFALVLFISIGLNLGSSLRFSAAFATTRSQSVFHSRSRLAMVASGAQGKAGLSKEQAELESESPNWRLLRKSDAGSSVSPFSHGDGDIALPSRWTQDQYESSLLLYEKLTSCKDEYVAPLIKSSLHCLENAYRLYGPQSVIGSYNGGKDAVVILHLMRAVHAKHHHNQISSGGGSISDSGIIRPRVIYFEHEDEFPQVLELLHDTVSQFDLDMIVFERGIKFAEGLQIIVDANYPNGANRNGDGQKAPPHPMAFVLGTRTSDPNAGSQGHFAPSSHWMPPFMRCNPVLEWTYGHVWHFLRLFQLPYCNLYDKGYTSLGTVKDTQPCPALAIPGAFKSNSELKYWPAYMLRDWDQERAGRIKKEKKKPAPVNITMSRSSSVLSVDTGSSAETKLDGKSGTTGNSKTAEFQTNTTAIQGLTESESGKSISSFGERTVGLIIIGDEILKGLTPDTNTHTAATLLRKSNVLLSRVVVVSDDQDEIVAVVKRMQQEADVIITSGGVGPTHDDVTLKSISVALGKEMEFHEGMADLLREKMNTGKDFSGKEGELTDAQVKMATCPAGSRLRYLSKDKSDWPILQCQNIFVLPGVPQFFEKKVEVLATYLSSEMERSVTFKVVLSIDENSIVDILNGVVERHVNVGIGSYPFVGQPELKTVVTLEGRQAPGGARSFSLRSLSEEDPSLRFSKEDMDMHVKAALADLIENLPEGSVLRLDNNDSLTFS
eukprot:scaffold19858_cov56-Attheya_sp.AAC.8